MMNWWVTEPDSHGWRMLDQDGANEVSVCQIKCEFLDLLSARGLIFWQCCALLMNRNCFS
jgi:hypothetical protein